MKKGLKITLIVVGILLFIGFMFVSAFVGGYNKLVTMDEEIKGKWAQVENQLKRRSDLIPNLINTVKGYAGHEKEVFTNIAESRAKLAGASNVQGKIAAANQMTSALGRLLVIVERYPDLKANQSFNRLMDELSGTENRLSVERMRYNNAVKLYNMYMKRFPGRFYAAIFGFSKADYFKIAEKDKEVPKVEF
jgi:LemA protein